MQRYPHVHGTYENASSFVSIASSLSGEIVNGESNASVIYDEVSTSGTNAVTHHKIAASVASASISEILPFELVSHIFGFLNNRDLFHCLPVCKKFFYAAVPLLYRSIELPATIVRPVLSSFVPALYSFPTKNHTVEMFASRTLDPVVREENMFIKHSDEKLQQPKQIRRMLSSLVVRQDSVTNFDKARLQESFEMRGETKRVILDDGNDITSATKRQKTRRQMSTTVDYGSFVRSLVIGTPHVVPYLNNEIAEDHLVTILSRCSHLHHLEIHQCFQLTSNALASIGVNICHALKKLVLTNSAIEDTVLSRLLQNCYKLQSLTLDGCSKISSFVFDNAPKFSRILEEISLEGCENLSEDGIEYLLSECPSIRKLNLSRNNCDFDFLHPSLFANLKILNLSENNLLHDHHISDILVNAPFLEELQLEKSSNITDAMWMQLPRDSRLFNLKKLNMTFVHQMTDTGGEILAKTLPNLEEVFLGKCLNVSDKTVAAIATHCKKLRRIYLAGCHLVTDLSIISLVSSCNNLEVLSIPGCSITDMSLIAACQRSASLCVAQFSFCTSVTPLAVCQLAASCPKLAILQLVNCPAILNSFIKIYSQPCPADLQSRYLDVYCAIRAPNIAELGKVWTNMSNVLQSR